MTSAKGGCELTVETDENGIKHVILPDCVKRILYSGEYCADHMDECYTRDIRDDKPTPFYKSKVPIEVYTQTVAPKHVKTDDKVLTTLVLPPDTDVYCERPDSQYLNKRKFIAAKVHVVNNRLYSMIYGSTNYDMYTYLSYSLSKNTKNYKYDNGCSYVCPNFSEYKRDYYNGCKYSMNRIDNDFFHKRKDAEMYN